ncbi:MAG: hypothetical protein Q9174_003546, partial [Haloplaca sp. 1 TL-2023]
MASAPQMPVSQQGGSVSTPTTTQPQHWVFKLAPYELTEDTLKTLHRHFPVDVPEFVSKGPVASSDAFRHVTMALSPRKSHKKVKSPTHNTIHSRPWGEDYHYWTIDLEGRRLIVKHLFTYKTWLGPGRGFAHKTLVNPLQRSVKEESPSSETASDSAEMQSESSYATPSPEEKHRRHSPIDLTKDEDIAPTAEPKVNPDTTGNVSLKPYNIDTILRQDRDHYGTELPPFVASIALQVQGVKKVELISRRHSQRTHIYSDVITRRWDYANAFSVIRIAGKESHMDVIVKDMPFHSDDEEPAKNMFFAWYGHKKGFDKKPIAYPVGMPAAAKQTPAKDKAITHGRSIPRPSVPSQQQDGSAPSSAPPANNGNKSSHSKTAVQSPASAQGRDDIASNMTTQGFHAALIRTRMHFGHRIPPFAEPRLGIHNGKEARVILAQDDNWAEVGSVAMAKAREWNPQTIFWTLNIELKMFILGRVNVDGRSGLKRWMGLGRGLERDVYAWIIDNGPIEGYQWRPVPLSSLQQTPGAVGTTIPAPGSMPRAKPTPSSKALKPAGEEAATTTNRRKRRYVLSDEEDASEGETLLEINAEYEKQQKNRAGVESVGEGRLAAKDKDGGESEEERHPPRSTKARMLEVVRTASSSGTIKVTTDRFLLQPPQVGIPPSPVNRYATPQSALEDDSLTALMGSSPTVHSRTSPFAATTLSNTEIQTKIGPAIADASPSHGRSVRQRASNVNSPSQGRNARPSSNDRLQTPTPQQDNIMTSPDSRLNKPHPASQPTA